MDKFKIVREDGRSNAQVLLDYFQKGRPGQIYTYEELASVLRAGTDRQYDTAAVRSIAMALYQRLLKEQARALHNVRNVGYRLAEAHDHNHLAVVRKRKSDMQLLKGVQTLQHVRWDEFKDPEARKAHEGQLMVMSALYMQQTALEKRTKSLEDMVSQIVSKQA